jgi:putative restriction endonuclease
MRISRRTSGGRGEYEISESAPNGLTPNELLPRKIVLEMSDTWQFDAGVHLSSQGSKRRLRRNAGTEIHLHRQVAAALMMPHPVRADNALGRGMPILQANRYAIEHLELASAELVGANAVRLRIHEIILLNLSHHAEQLHFADRLAQLDRVWQNRAELPEHLADLINQHRALTHSGQPIPEQAERVVEQRQRTVTENAADLGILYRSEGQDALPDLLSSLSEPPPAPPIAVADVDPDETEIKRRTVKEWKRWAASRGAASARFRQAVRQAWNSTCAVCGLHLPSTAHNTSAGVDAAHILPWADYELDHVCNGICLCKHHHWAFDEGLILIRAENGVYSIEVPADMAQSILAEKPDFGLASLSDFAGQIPEARLPRRRQDRPKPRYLELLRESSS